jgi:hypothetical protein
VSPPRQSHPSKRGNIVVKVARELRVGGAVVQFVGHHLDTSREDLASVVEQRFLSDIIIEIEPARLLWQTCSSYDT